MHMHMMSQVQKCVMAGAVGVIMVNTGRGYELMAPEDLTAVSAAWPASWQVFYACVTSQSVGGEFMYTHKCVLCASITCV